MTGASLQTTAYAVAYITFAIGTSTVFLRVYCRRYIIEAWGWDDNIALVVGVVSCGQQVILHLFLRAGCGLTIESLGVQQQLEILKILFVEEVYYYLVHWIINSAFLLFYLRLSPDKIFRTLVFVGMASECHNLPRKSVSDDDQLAYDQADTFSLIACLQCIPFDEILHPETHAEAKCRPRIILLVVPSVLSIVQDIYILVLPISTVLRLQMSTRRKIAVTCVIGFGVAAVLVACFRLIPILELNSSPDTSYVLGKMVIVAAVEIQLAIVAVNLPSLKALWIRMTEGSSAGSKPYEGYKLSTHQSHPKKGKRVSKGSITRLEHNVKSTESEEELVVQAGLHKASSKTDTGILVTREVAVETRP